MPENWDYVPPSETRPRAVRCHFGDAKQLPAIHRDQVWANGRVLGSAKAEFTVPDDFDDPLPKEVEDLFWY
jgi:hypothetical protein